MPRLLSIMEVVKIIEASQGITKSMLTLMYLYCLRPNEVTGLQIEDVDFKRLVFNIKGKSRSKKTFPMIPVIEEMLRKAIGKRESGPVFTSVDGGPVRDLRNRLTIAKGGACITRSVSLHDLRHSCATHLLDHCENLSTIEDLFGFEGAGSAFKNTKDTLGNIRDASRALWDHYLKMSIALGFTKPVTRNNGKKPDNEG